MKSLQDEAKQEVAAYAEWFKNKHGRYPRPGALRIIEKLSGMLMKYERKGQEDARFGSTLLDLEAFAEIVVENFPEVNSETGAKFTVLLHQFYVNGYRKEASPCPDT